MSELAAALEREFGEAVALDAGFSGEPSPEYWEARADAVRASLEQESELGWALVRAILATPNSMGFVIRASRYGSGKPHGRATYEWSSTNQYRHGPNVLAKTPELDALNAELVAAVEWATR